MQHRNAPFKLPLICPECLREAHTENVLDPRFSCVGCSTIYPCVDGIPVLIADRAARAEVTSSAPWSSDERTAFYQRQSPYLREKIGGYDAELHYYLSVVEVPGLLLEIGSGAGVFVGLGGNDYCALDFSLTWLRAYIGGYRSICATADCIPLASRC